MPTIHPTQNNRSILAGLNCFGNFSLLAFVVKLGDCNTYVDWTISIGIPLQTLESLVGVVEIQAVYTASAQGRALRQFVSPGCLGPVIRSMNLYCNNGTSAHMCFKFPYCVESKLLALHLT